MDIITAKEEDFEELMEFFDFMCTVLGSKMFMPKGNRGGFPSGEMVSEAIEEKCLFKGVENGRIVAAYILNHSFDDAYRTVKWGVDAQDEEILVMHALRVHPDFGGRGISKRFVEHAIKAAAERKMKAIRLDVLEGNTIPERMYLSFGFKYVDTVPIFYEDIGEARNFRLLEYIV